jgi:hypothetical protein
MLTEDYLIRRINQAIALILHAVGLRKDGLLVAAQTDIDIALELLLGMRAVLLKQMDDDSLLRLLTVRGELDLERLVLVADLYAEEGLILDAQARPGEAYQDNLRALHFSLTAALGMPINELPSERMQRIATLLGWFKDRRLPVDTQALLIDYDQNLLELEPRHLAAAGLERAAIQAELERLLAGFRPV